MSPLTDIETTTLWHRILWMREIGAKELCLSSGEGRALLTYHPVLHRDVLQNAVLGEADEWLGFKVRWIPDPRRWAPHPYMYDPEVSKHSEAK